MDSRDRLPVALQMPPGGPGWPADEIAAGPSTSYQRCEGAFGGSEDAESAEGCDSLGLSQPGEGSWAEAGGGAPNLADLRPAATPADDVPVQSRSRVRAQA